MDGHGQARTNTDGMVREYAISRDPPAGPPSEKMALIVAGDFCFNSLNSETPTNRKDFLHVC